MIVGIAGGNLQGVEAAYLTGKAGWVGHVVDKRPYVPASGLCDRFSQADLTDEAQVKKVFSHVDFIIPALENSEALKCLAAFSRRSGVPLAFDAGAYEISSSKRVSDRLFDRLEIPAPLPWPDCGFPVIGKPDSASGSRDVLRFDNRQQLDAHIRDNRGQLPDVLQSFLEGPSFSMEVMGIPGRYTALQTTDLYMDPGYDCCRVTAPARLSPHLDETLCRLSLDLARAVNLTGIMDVEVILHQDRLKVLEIDARLPSQTPTAVFLSTGINMVELLGDIFVHGAFCIPCPTLPLVHVSYEHILAGPEGINNAGEHVMSVSSPLYLQTGLFGADEVISDYRPGMERFSATLILTGSSRKALADKRRSVLKRIEKTTGMALCGSLAPAAEDQEAVR